MIHKQIHTMQNSNCWMIISNNLPFLFVFFYSIKISRHQQQWGNFIHLQSLQLDESVITCSLMAAGWWWGCGSINKISIAFLCFSFWETSSFLEEINNNLINKNLPLSLQLQLLLRHQQSAYVGVIILIE